MQNKNYKELLQGITTFVFDVDGVLTNGNVLISNEGHLLRTMSVKDGFALKTAIEHNYSICIITGGSDLGVHKRLENLGVKELHLGISEKLPVLQAFLDRQKISANEVIYMGDDIPDLPCMRLVGLACCPKDAVPEIKAISHYISDRKGGKGCVRDIIEQVLKVQSKWMLEFKSGGD